jgi:hypothetical protein
MDEDRISDVAMRLVVRKRRPPGSLADIMGDGDPAARAEALLARLEGTADLNARARLLVEIAITLRDGLDDNAQAVDALLEAWRSDPTNDDILEPFEASAACLRVRVADDARVNCRERLAELTSDPVMRGRHNLIAGQLRTPIDGVAARRYFERAVQADPANGAAWSALPWDARAENDHARAASRAASVRRSEPTREDARARGLVLG